ncbi:MAG: hypothetical protein ACLU38_14665 [Dysosmobacter sp.]
MKKITFVTIKRHILPNIRHQPVKISEVLFAAAHSKGQRRCDRKHSEDDIPLRNLQKKLKHLEHHDNAENNDQQPCCTYGSEYALIYKCDINCVRNLEQLNDL